MYAFLRKYLSWLARMILFFKKPYIIGVTGTAGKTTISRFIVLFLQKEFGEDFVEFSRYNYNGEFGLPLAVIGAKTGGKNPLKWFLVGCVAFGRIFRSYPRFLVLEYGVDHIGEMDFLLSIAIPDVAIVSPIVPNHMENFLTLESYQKEKLKILGAKKVFLHESLHSVISERYTTNVSDKKIAFFGKDFKELCDVFVENISGSIDGISAAVSISHENFPIHLSLLGDFQAENILPIFLLAEELSVDKKKISEYCKDFIVPSGRSGIFRGMNDAYIIDGTYNGGYLSIVEGLRSVAHFSEKYKVFVLLGDMRELGPIETEKHTELAREIIRLFPDPHRIEIYLVGDVMKKIVLPILSEKYSVSHYQSSRLLGSMISQKILTSKEKTIVYAKGSQNTIFLEEALKEILPEEKHAYLCRQSDDWMKRKRKFFTSVENTK